MVIRVKYNLLVNCELSFEFHIGCLSIGNAGLDNVGRTILVGSQHHGDIDQRTNFGRGHSRQSALLDGLYHEFLACEHFGTLADGLDVAHTRAHWLMREVSTIDIGIRKQRNQIDAMKGGQDVLLLHLEIFIL